MRSIFWIGCVLTVLVSLLVSGAFAESVNNSTVKATGALDVNKTVPAQEATSVNVTDKAVNATSPAAKVNATSGKAANVTTTEPDLVNDTLVKFVNDARTFALNSGKTTALATFNSPSSQFSNDKMYIFAYDTDGKALALPYDLGSVGKNMISATDSTGLRYVQQMVDVAKIPGVGFVKYQEINPLKQGTIMNKVSYVASVDGTYFIGAGVYMTKDDKKTPAKAEVTANITGSAVNATNATLPSDTPVKTAVKEAVKEVVNKTVSNLTA
ncbi:cache domain-containing protein [uncultured Methanospirillum sp.]|uniref:cache domain-containing protein n=1 Tax=uncultured Methanospirillum sp. TaxID=262503 RepID=UPI0029C94BF2|nr:cache domain-containing protein [uncultured Methanospirillum sp.]